MSLKKKILKNLDILIYKRLLKNNKYFLLFYKSNLQKVLLNSKDMYYYNKNIYPLILIKFKYFNRFLDFIKINHNSIVFINVGNFIYKNYLHLTSFLFMPNLFFFLIKKHLILFKIKQINLNNLSFFKNF